MVQRNFLTPSFHSEIFDKGQTFRHLKVILNNSTPYTNIRGDSIPSTPLAVPMIGFKDYLTKDSKRSQLYWRAVPQHFQEADLLF